MSAQAHHRRGRFAATAALLCPLLGFVCAAYIFFQPDVLRSPWGTSLGRDPHSGGTRGPSGRWKPRRSPRGEQHLREAIARLESIGYLGGCHPHPDAAGVIVHDSERAYPGLNLYASGHATKAFLMTMAGEVLHEWGYEFRKVWPEYKRARNDVSTSQDTEYWRRVHMYNDGCLLAIHEGIGIIKLDRDSQLQWAYSGRCHHDLFVAEDGTIYVLTRKARIIERIHATQPILEDFITLLGPAGTVRRHISILECFENSRYAPFLDQMKPFGDVFHTNTLEILDGRFESISPVFSAGNALVSIRELNVIAIVDIDAETVVYALAGMWVKQHDPTLVEDGRMLLFDNLGNRGRSKVIEFAPLSQQISWTYGLDPSEYLFSESCGTCQRLPNGNTLITETDNGRAIEVTPQNDIVWEFVNPARAGEDGELIATLPEVIRIPDPERFDWLKQPASPE